MGTAMRQCGHSKSANSTTVTGASSGPLDGEPSSGMALTPGGSKRSLYARWIWLSDAPSRTAWAIHLAAGVHGAAGALLLHALGDRDGHVWGTARAGRHERAALLALARRHRARVDARQHDVLDVLILGAGGDRRAPAALDAACVRVATPGERTHGEGERAHGDGERRGPM